MAASIVMQRRGAQAPCDSRDLGDGDAGCVAEACRYERGWEGAQPSRGDRAGSSSPAVCKRDAEMGLEVRKRTCPICLKHILRGNLGCNVESQTGEEKVACCAHQKCTKIDPKRT